MFAQNGWPSNVCLNQNVETINQSVIFATPEFQSLWCHWRSVSDYIGLDPLFECRGSISDTVYRPYFIVLSTYGVLKPGWTTTLVLCWSREDWNCSNAFSLQNESKTVRYVPSMTIRPIVFVPEHTGYKMEQLYLFLSYKI